MLPASGVYAITNRNNGKRYIGSAANLRQREQQHLCALRRGDHHSGKLQRAFVKHGETAFSFSTLLLCSPENRLMYEQRAIDGFHAVDGGYNVLPKAGSCLGVKRSEETKARVGAASRSRTDETRAKMSASQKLRAQQRVLTEVDRERLGQWAALANKARRGKQMSPEARARMSVSQRKRIAEGRAGSCFKPGHIISAETRAKMSATHRGLAHSSETRAKIAAANRSRAAQKAGAL